MEIKLWRIVSLVAPAWLTRFDEDGFLYIEGGAPGFPKIVSNQIETRPTEASTL